MCTSSCVCRPNEAIQAATTTTAEQIREELKTANVPVGAINTTSPTGFHVEGVPQDRDADFRRIADTQAGTNYDRQPGVAGAYDFTMKPNIAKDLREQAVVQALDTIDRRVNELGVAEPNISRYGQTGDQILVQLPGVSDVGHAKEIIRSTAQLELKLVEAGPAPSQEALLQSFGGKVPPDMEVVPGAGVAGDTSTSFYLLKKVPAATGRDLRSAKPSLDENNRPAVSFTLTSAGSRRVREGDGREHRPLSRHRPGQARAIGAAHRRPHHRSGNDLRLLHDGRSERPLADASIRSAAGRSSHTSRNASSAQASAQTRSDPASSHPRPD